MPKLHSERPFCRESGTGARKQQIHLIALCGEKVKLLRERRVLTVAIFRLLFTQHMNQLDAT